MPWIDLDDVKAHLNKTSVADDNELEGFIGAACALIEDIKGHVDLVDVTEVLPAYTVNNSHQGSVGFPYREHVVLLTQSPVCSVTSVAFLPGDGTSSTVAQQDIAAGVAYGWRADGAVLHVPLATYRYGGFRVAYKAGYQTVPQNYRMAALELVAHLWRSTQMNAGRPQVGETDTEVIRGMTYALPFRVRELLGIYGASIGVAGVTLA